MFTSNDISLGNMAQIALGCANPKEVNIAILHSLLDFLLRKLNCADEKVTLTGVACTQLQTLLHKSSPPQLHLYTENKTEKQLKFSVRLLNLERNLEEIENKLNTYLDTTCKVTHQMPMMLHSEKILCTVTICKEQHEIPEILDAESNYRKAIICKKNEQISRKSASKIITNKMLEIPDAENNSLTSLKSTEKHLISEMLDSNQSHKIEAIRGLQKDVFKAASAATENHKILYNHRIFAVSKLNNQIPETVESLANLLKDASSGEISKEPPNFDTNFDEPTAFMENHEILEIPDSENEFYKAYQSKWFQSHVQIILMKQFKEPFERLERKVKELEDIFVMMVSRESQKFKSFPNIHTAFKNLAEVDIDFSRYKSLFSKTLVGTQEIMNSKANNFEISELKKSIITKFKQIERAVHDTEENLNEIEALILVTNFSKEKEKSTSENPEDINTEENACKNRAYKPAMSEMKHSLLYDISTLEGELSNIMRHQSVRL